MTDSDQIYYIVIHSHAAQSLWLHWRSYCETFTGLELFKAGESGAEHMSSVALMQLQCFVEDFSVSAKLKTDFYNNRIWHQSVKIYFFSSVYIFTIPTLLSHPPPTYSIAESHSDWVEAGSVFTVRQSFIPTQVPLKTPKSHEYNEPIKAATLLPGKITVFLKGVWWLWRERRWYKGFGFPSERAGKWKNINIVYK